MTKGISLRGDFVTNGSRLSSESFGFSRSHDKIETEEYNIIEERSMAKSQDVKKDVKKKPQKTLKEKRTEKKQKKAK
jgi:hypothetical protein